MIRSCLLCLGFATLIGCADASAVPETFGSVAVGRAYRVDAVFREVLYLKITGDEPQPVIPTGFTSGAHQGALLVLTPGYELITHHHVPGQSPYPAYAELARRPGQCHRELMVAVPKTVKVVDTLGRKFITYLSRGTWDPSSFVVVDVTGGNRLETVYEFWNYGHLHHVSSDGHHVALTGRRRRDDGSLAICVAVLDFLAVVSAAPPSGSWHAAAPDGSVVKPLPDPGFRLYAVLPDEIDEHPVEEVTFEENTVRAYARNGLIWEFSTKTWAYDVKPSDNYRKTWKPGPRAATLEAHLEDLRTRTRAITAAD